ncbi:MAG: creatininase family protein [Bacillota bacterium]|nr:creatininase family protein [Bacillota bacterium]
MSMREYAELTYTELAALSRQRTVFLGCVSPLEVHGPHLPLGTDVFVAEELRRRYAAALAAKHPELELIAVPPLYAGSDPLPFPGSIDVPPAVLEGHLLALARSLARQGFRYLLLADNHGGPRHQLAVESAARKAWRRFGFYLIDPFGVVYRYMVQHDPEFLAITGLAPGRCGDDPDAHAGTNETSLMLAARPELVKEEHRRLPASCPPTRSTVRSVVGAVAAVLRALGARETAADLVHLGETLAWVGDPQKLPYMGSPALATAEAGEAMYRGHVRVMLDLMDQALHGKPVDIRPLLWAVRFLKALPS